MKDVIIFKNLEEFAKSNNLEITPIIERRIDGITILKFTDIITGKHVNIVLSMYDRLNISEKEIVKEITDQVKRRLLKTNKKGE